jgi:hypothetical protein
MSKQLEALKLALEALDVVKLHYTQNRHVNEAITAIKEALALPVQEPDCYGYAARLATSIWKQHYQKTAPEWQVFDELMGVLTQIDNMTAGLVSPPLPVQEERNFCQRCGKRTADLTVIHTCTPPRENT